jgi:hypothetical protein
MLEDSATMAPDELLARLIRLFPDFGAHWDGPDNDEREADGSFTLHGAFTEFSLYFIEHYEELPPERLQGLSWLLLECMAEPDTDLDEAAASGFLENVAAERFHADFERYLIGRPLEFYAQWSIGG